MESGAGLHIPETRTPQVAARARSGRRQLSRSQESDPAPPLEYGVRERRLPQCGRMLEPAHRDVSDSGQRLHPSLRLRCGAEGRTSPGDYDEPERVAEAVEAMGLKFAVITSVNRDDRADGGAELFALVIRAIRRRIPGCGVEVLIPDFQGNL